MPIKRPFSLENVLLTISQTSLILIHTEHSAVAQPPHQRVESERNEKKKKKVTHTITAAIKHIPPSGTYHPESNAHETQPCGPSQLA